MLLTGAGVSFSGCPGPLPRAGGQSAMLRFIVGMLWIILLVFIVLVFLNVPGVR